MFDALLVRQGWTEDRMKGTFGVSMILAPLGVRGLHEHTVADHDDQPGKHADGYSVPHGDA